MDRRSLLKIIRNRSSTPVEIFRSTGWRQSNVCTILERLRSYGLVKRVRANRPGRGRQSNYYSITGSGLKRLAWWKKNPGRYEKTFHGE